MVCLGISPVIVVDRDMVGGSQTCHIAELGFRFGSSAIVVFANSVGICSWCLCVVVIIDLDRTRIEHGLLAELRIEEKGWSCLLDSIPSSLPIFGPILV